MFWENVESMRKKLGMNKVQLSREIGKGDSQVRVWMERGTIPPADYAVKIARYFGTTVEALVDSPDEGKSSDKTFAAEIAVTYGSSKIQMLIEKAKRLPVDKIDVLLQVADGFLPDDASANSSQNAG